MLCGGFFKTFYRLLAISEGGNGYRGNDPRVRTGDGAGFAGEREAADSKSGGIEATIINGEVLVEKGNHAGALPGTVLDNGNALQGAA